MKYPAAFLYSDWLYFLLHGMNGVRLYSQMFLELRENKHESFHQKAIIAYLTVGDWDIGDSIGFYTLKNNLFFFIFLSKGIIIV